MVLLLEYNIFVLFPPLEVSLEKISYPFLHYGNVLSISIALKSDLEMLDMSIIHILCMFAS